MKKESKRYSQILFVVLFLFVMLFISALIFMRFGGFNTGDSANLEEIVKCAGTVEDLSIPINSIIIALGEATHRNKEFQQLKLDVFKSLVENHGVRSFALEGDYGCCEQVNRYMHDGQGTAQEAEAV